METQLLLPKNGAEPSPQFSAHVHCGQTAGWIKTALGMEVGLGPSHIVLDGDSASLPKKGAEPPSEFLAHFYCAQTVGCIKVPLGMEVGLSPCDCVIYGDPAPPPKGGGAPNFLLMSIVATWLHASRSHMVQR